MQIELTEDEIKILDQSLEAWINEPVTSGLFKSVMKGLVLGRHGLAQESEAEVKADIARAQTLQSTRRLVAAVMRAKLMLATRA